MSPGVPLVELGTLGFDAGAHVILNLALRSLESGNALAVRGAHPELAPHLTAWCRREGHRCRVVPADAEPRGVVAYLERATTASVRSNGAVRAGRADPDIADAIVAVPSADWGLAARGALVEPGGPTPPFRLDRRDELWTDRAPAFYRQSAASQWDPDGAVGWSEPVRNAPVIEAAVVQVMTFLIENEVVALVVPARFLGQIHPHFREIQQQLAVIAADEARHIDVFTRRATLAGNDLALSTVGGRMSLQTLLDEPDFAIASFLLSVMGEGTFISLLGFLEAHAPDPLTRRIAHLTRNDEARHVAFAMAHLERHATIDTALRARLARAVDRRHRELQSTAGLNDEVFDSLVLLAAGTPEPEAIRAGWNRVQALQHEMREARQGRLARLGFTTAEADTIASLHTRNFM